jgi:hypothetical protein
MIHNRFNVTLEQDSVSTTIARGTSISAYVVCGGLHLSGIIMPSAWTPADITFQGSIDGENYYNIYDAAGNEYDILVDAGRYILLDVQAFRTPLYLKIRSGTASVSVTQSDDRVITLLFGAL